MLDYLGKLKLILRKLRTVNISVSLSRNPKPTEDEFAVSVSMLCFENQRGTFEKNVEYVKNVIEKELPEFILTDSKIFRDYDLSNKYSNLVRLTCRLFFENVLYDEATDDILRDDSGNQVPEEQDDSRTYTSIIKENKR